MIFWINNGIKNFSPIVNMSAANLYIGRKMFDSPPLETVMMKLRKYK